MTMYGTQFPGKPRLLTQHRTNTPRNADHDIARPLIIDFAEPGRASVRHSDMRRSWISAGLTALVVAGCGTEEPASSPVDGSPSQIEGFRAHASGSDGGMDAIVSGTVEIDQDTGCIWLSDPDGTRYPVVWPAGTVAQSDPIGVVLSDGELVQDGDNVAGGGGYIDVDGATSGQEPFPDACVQVGEAAVFNADSSITVEHGVGLEVEETLVARFSPPEPIGFELVAVDSDSRSVAVVDFVTGTVHRYEPGRYPAPADAIDGASGGGGFTHLWASGTVYTYWPLDSEPLVYQPDPLRDDATLRVLPAPDGDHTWLVQSEQGEPTLIELVNVVELQLSRLMSTHLEGRWVPVGTTVEGLILTSDEPRARTSLVAADGTVVTEVDGTTLSAGWNGASILRPDGSLFITDAGLENPTHVEKPADGEWASVGGPVVPTSSPPVRTGAENYLVMLANEPGQRKPSAEILVMVDSAGSASVLDELSSGSSVAAWSRGGDWVITVEDSSVALISVADGSTTQLGDLVPDSHAVLTAG